jgi:two-component system phosphate regulon sensor histidine kinase PhoR
VPRKSIIRKISTKLFGLFAIALAAQSLVLGLLLCLTVRSVPGGALLLLAEVLFSLLLAALAVAFPLSAWVAHHARARLNRIVEFVQSNSKGESNTRLEVSSGDEMAAMEKELNRTADRLNHNFAELDERHQQLAAMLDAMQEAVVAVTPEGTVRWSNAVMKRIAGTQIRIGRPLAHSVRDPELLACVRTALEKREVHIGRASTLVQGRVYEISSAPLPRGGALAVLYDLTRLEAAERARRDFLANVSHELRTPLTSIQGYVETLIDMPHPDPETSLEFLGIVLKNATRMNRLTEDLLALASLESPDKKFTRLPVHAKTLVQDAIDALGGMVVDSGVDLQFAGAPETQVMVDAYAMSQVFGNLVENAIKYAKEGRKILVGAHLLSSEVDFFVQDFGPGIASEHLDRIFERFYRVDKARSRESGGTGLGLAIVKHIVLAHEGRIWAESELGSGTTFHFALPLAPGEVGAPDQEEAETPEAS